jgi:L-histidine Nalpha-methyltransferase
MIVQLENEIQNQIAEQNQTAINEVLSGLLQRQKELPCKYFYDKRGAELFDEICELPEYYLTRTELEIMKKYAGEMADCIGPRAAVIEYGSGSAVKTQILLQALDKPSLYVPMDISAEYLEYSVRKLSRHFPHLQILPVQGDFTDYLNLAPYTRWASKKIIYFPGSTIGNFRPAAAKRLLRQMFTQCGPGGGVLIGVDLLKEKRILEAAYNDSRGVTAEFNLNLLQHLNDVYGSDFNSQAFRHRAVFNSRQSRVEMYLVSLYAQTVAIWDRLVFFKPNESILTECSYKYSITSFKRLAQQSGFTAQAVWADANHSFSIHFLNRP